MPETIVLFWCKPGTSVVRYASFGELRWHGRDGALELWSVSTQYPLLMQYELDDHSTIAQYVCVKAAELSPSPLAKQWGPWEKTAA